MNVSLPNAKGCSSILLLALSEEVSFYFIHDCALVVLNRRGHTVFVNGILLSIFGFFLLIQSWFY